MVSVSARARSGARSVGMGAAAALAVLAAVAVCVGVSYISSPRLSTTVLLSDGQEMEKSLASAQKGLAVLQKALPKGSIAHKYGKEEGMLRSIFTNGEKQLKQVEHDVAAQDRKEARKTAQVKHAQHRAAVSSLNQVRGNEKTMQRLVERTEKGMKTLIAQIPPKDRAMFPSEAKDLQAVLSKSLAALHTVDQRTRAAAAKKEKHFSLLARGTPTTQRTSLQNRLDHEKSADDKENKALSTAEDVRTVMDGINSLPEAKPHAKPVAKKAHIQSLADSANALDESTTRQWGKVYNPQASPKGLTGLAAKEYAGWASEVDKVDNVYDPMEDKHPEFRQLRSTDWWKNKNYVISGKHSSHHGDDDWWSHDHTGRGY